MRVGIINYGAGNVAGLSHALTDAGADVAVCDGDTSVFDALVLPGVGNFAWCARELEERGYWETVKEWAASGKLLLGVCVGMQLLFEESEEGPAKGLGILPGKVVRLNAPRLPHVGWNEVDGRGYFYFSHSFGVDPFSLPAGMKALATGYHDVVIAEVKQDNILGVQFHPEKSGQAGVAFLREWVRSI